MDRIRINGHPSADDASEVLAVWAEIFPEPGVYEVARVDPLLKAAAGGAAERFEEWFLQQLEDAARDHFRTSQLTMWEVLEALLQRHGVYAPSELELFELNRTLFDLTHASTANMVGLRVPTELVTRLTALGWTPREALDFPALAYRIGRIYDQLQAGRPMPWSDVRAAAQSYPLSSIEQRAIAHARARGAQFLRPVFARGGEVWAVEREIPDVQRSTERSIAGRVGPRKAARELAKLERAQGIFRDAERVMITEMAEASAQGAWAERSTGWNAETRLYRLPSRGACRGCLRLFVQADGRPRLYTVGEIDAGEALGVNTGAWRNWHVRRGTIHPNCVCPPWLQWNDGMQRMFDRNAPRFAEQVRQLRVFEDAA